MAKGTWDILNDDSMTTPISTNNDTISNDETSVVNEPAYATYDYTEDDYGNITYYVQNLMTMVLVIELMYMYMMKMVT